ncbi:hypothetical protein WA026_013280 [Henosepilachna vigintioctopunctata]|uniref:Uncharacterized protein n=1 Tax=Henosepilachna vigintioctopunctata TaxID=420089 RepID=A0AAW1UJF3_9CUCU
MKDLRRTLGVTRKDKIRNTTIREELGVQPVLEFIEQRQLSWGHIQRMDNNSQVKRTYEAIVQTKGKKERPRQTWNTVLGNIIQERGGKGLYVKIKCKPETLGQKGI